MKTSKLMAGVLLAGISAMALASQGQDGAPPSMAGPEHKLLEKWAGQWETTMKMGGSADAPPTTTPGTSKARLECGGLWLITDFDSSIMGMPFHGHETLGYDAAKKKYVLCWVDSMSSSLSIGEGTFDAKTSTMNFVVKGRDMTGAEQTWRQADVWKDADTREWTMWSQSADGKEQQDLQIVYKRKK